MILFGSNITTPTALVALTAKLRAAAAAGGQPHAPDRRRPGRRLGQADPVGAADALAAADGAIARGIRRPRPGRRRRARRSALSASTSTSRRSPTCPRRPPRSCTARVGRSRSTPPRTAALADAFATGLESKRVVPTMKHFPGIGYATRNTDAYVVTITASAGRARPGPRAVSDGDRAPHPADHALERHVHRLRPAQRGRLVPRDRHDAAARATSASPASRSPTRSTGRRMPAGSATRVLAVSAARAGTDMILTTGSELSTSGVYATLMRQAQEGLIPLSTLRTSYTRILALKASFTDPRAHWRSLSVDRQGLRRSRPPRRTSLWYTSTRGHRMHPSRTRVAATTLVGLLVVACTPAPSPVPTAVPSPSLRQVSSELPSPQPTRAPTATPAAQTPTPRSAPPASPALPVHARARSIGDARLPVARTRCHAVRLRPAGRRLRCCAAWTAMAGLAQAGRSRSRTRRPAAGPCRSTTDQSASSATGPTCPGSTTTSPTSAPSPSMREGRLMRRLAGPAPARNGRRDR